MKPERIAEALTHQHDPARGELLKLWQRDREENPTQEEGQTELTLTDPHQVIKTKP